RFADGIARLPTLRLRASTTFLASVDMELTRQRIRESQFDVCLACDPNSVSLTIDSGQQIQRNVDVDALHFTAGSPGEYRVLESCKAFPLVVHPIQFRR